MRKKSSRRRIDVNVDELDRIIDAAMQAPLNEADGRTLKTAVHAMAERLIRRRNTEKTSAVLEPKTPPAAVDTQQPEEQAAAGHGRNGASAFTGANRVAVGHATLQSGDPCPECKEGRVYRQKEPATLIRIVGQPPLEATVFEMERLRCNGCGEVFTAAEPPAAGAEKFDATAVAMIALLKYGTGMPFNRMKRLEGQLGIPLPATTQWELMAAFAKWLKPVLGEFIRQAAQGGVVHNDDTGMRILQIARRGDDGRTGTFTSGIVSISGGFPDECRYVLESLGAVYGFDAEAKDLGLTPKARLEFHQTHSVPVMEALHQWMETQFAEHKTEPNSGLGKAISYLLRHWTKLTLFLRQPGAPLDNNIVERALKKAILHRKNALFYKTMNGARVGDLFMSLIHTCELNRVNPFEYLTELLRHRADLTAHPAEWMPWNYRRAAAAVAA